MNISVAIDGPAAAGKSTIANIIAHRFSLVYINTGFMYRAVTLMCMKEDVSYTDVQGVCEIAKSLEICFDGDRILVNGKDFTDLIRQPNISSNVSNYAAISELRKLLVDMQQKIASKCNVVMDGRDIGTVVLKNAPLKFFLTASASERAKRRCVELNKKGIPAEYDKVLDEIIKRDYIDSHRAVSPLVKSEDAVEIDSSNLSILEVVEIISKYIIKYIEGHNQ
ncbi:(d)CMP kinase [Clostridium sp. MT-14]|uniref:Cytidylate kinase n=1 Tax=Clostridium aromativorans TaxID=2836848 RepID=A0ABS8N6T8_9CLOT|nr:MULTISPECIES: (d)CMP kinase [Clostridium]KAA8663479.1 (d)CMP kinase [Clostridium sp. HV4-5-A1G]MCC9295523.1 (d)CMP kinase [Clostridium aromativorans]CAB1245127.1 cytidylate kinase [Clostridiaceae bacterium BL-3]